MVDMEQLSCVGQSLQPTLTEIHPFGARQGFAEVPEDHMISKCIQCLFLF